MLGTGVLKQVEGLHAQQDIFCVSMVIWWPK